MQYENDTNAQVIHVWVMENKEVEIHLKEAKAHTATEAMRAKQVEVKVLQLSLMMKGIMPDAKCGSLRTFSSTCTYILLLHFCFQSLFSYSLCHNPSVVLHDVESTTLST